MINEHSRTFCMIWPRLNRTFCMTRSRLSHTFCATGSNLFFWLIFFLYFIKFLTLARLKIFYKEEEQNRKKSVYNAKVMCWKLIHIRFFSHNFWYKNHINARFAALKTRFQECSKYIFYTWFWQPSNKWQQFKVCNI